MSDADRARQLLGRRGVLSVLDHLDAPSLVRYAKRVEELGFGALWINETYGREPFAVLGALARETHRLTLAVGIASIYARDPVSARNGARAVWEFSGGRFVMGLGVSHRQSVEEVRGHRYEPPLVAMGRYLDAYDAAPYRAAPPAQEPPLVLAALGPRMLGLAAQRSAGAFPYLVTPEFVAHARTRLDAAAAAAGRPRPILVVSQAAVLQSDRQRARAGARAYLERHLGQPNYQRNLARMGFTADEIEAPGADRLVDALVAWGDGEAIEARLLAMDSAGADHVAVVPISAKGRQAHVPTTEAVAPTA